VVTSNKRRPLLAVAGGLALGLSTPPTDVLPGVPLSILLLALALRRAPSTWRGFGLGVLWASTAGLIGMRFVPSVIQLFTDLGTPLAYLAHVLLSVAQSLHWAIGSAIAVWLMRRRVPLELALASGVFVALSLPSVFLWSFASLLSPWPALCQSAELVGEKGVSVLLTLVVTLAIRAAVAWDRATFTRKDGGLSWRHARRAAMLKPAIAAAGLLGLMLAHGACVMQQYDDGSGDQVRIGLVHAAIEPKFRWEKKNWPYILQTLREQTALAERDGSELTIWPEAAYPYTVAHDVPREPRGRRAIRGRTKVGLVRGPIIVGLISAEPARRLADGTPYQDRFNSATLLDRQGRMQPSYDKMQLLWFGETVPGGTYFPWLKRAFQRSGGLIPGREVRGLTLERSGEPAVRLALLNCYEDTLPDVAREGFLATNPNLLVNVTNDAWFMGTAEPELHVRLSVLRSIELRRDMVRAVNHGVPAWIDAAGRVRARFDSDSPGAWIVTPTLRAAPPTFYARFGDWPTTLLLLGGVAFFAWRSRAQ